MFVRTYERGNPTNTKGSGDSGSKEVGDTEEGDRVSTCKALFVTVSGSRERKP